MKNILRNSLAIVILITFFLVVFINSTIIVAPYLQRHASNVEVWASKVFGKNVRVGKIEGGTFGLEPVIKLKDVVLTDSETNHELLKIKELQLGLDVIGSLSQWRLEPGLIIIDGTSIFLALNEDGSVKASSLGKYNSKNSSNGGVSSTLPNAISWLITKGKIVLKNVDITIQKSSGETLHFSNLNLELINYVNHRDLSTNGTFSDKTLFPLATNFVLNLQIRGDIRDPKTLNVKGSVRLQNFQVNMDGQSPMAFENFLPWVGHINFDLSHIIYSNGAVFRQPLSLDNISGIIDWQKKQNGWHVELDTTKLQNSQLQAHGKILADFIDGVQSPSVDMTMSFLVQDIANLKNLYPAHIMNKELLAWLDQAFPEGRSVSGSLILKGALQDFPFDDPQRGKFLIDTKVNDITLHYFHDWPPLKHIYGSMIFTGRSMHIRANSANIIDVPVSNVTTDIDDLARANLVVNGIVNTDSANGLNFLDMSPLHEKFGNEFHEISMHGPMQLQLKLEIPLTSAIKNEAQFSGAIKLSDNILQAAQWNLEISKLQGGLIFDNDKLSSQNLTAELFNKPIAIDVSSQNEPTNEKKSAHLNKIQFEDNLTIQELQKLSGFSLAKYLSGAANYQFGFNMYSAPFTNKNNVTIVSDLNGVEINLPEPFKKSAETSHQFQLKFNYAADQPQLSLGYDNKIHGIFAFQKRAELTNLKFFSGELLFGRENATLPNVPGLQIIGALSKLDFDAWKTFLFPTNAKTKGKEPSSQSLKISKIKLAIDDLNIFSQHEPSVKINATYKSPRMLIAVSNPNFDGTITLPDAFPNLPLQCNFHRFYLKQNLDSNQSLFPTDSTLTPQKVPPFSFVANNFRYKNNSFGYVAFSVIPYSDGKKGVSLNKIKITSPDFKMEGIGRWETENKVERSFLEGNVTSNNVGDALKHWGFTNNLVHGIGSANIAFNWIGPFYDPTLAKTVGNISFAVQNGTIVNLDKGTDAKMGISRILNILSLQSLPRRLTLDFSDLVKEGFSFDTLKGNLKLQDTNIYTNDTELDGSVAKVKATGRIGISAKDFDMVLQVFPNITSSLPVIATVAGGPVAGAATWLANKVILTKGVGQFTSYKYIIKGPWAKPNIQ